MEKVLQIVPLLESLSLELILKDLKEKSMQREIMMVKMKVWMVRMLVKMRVKQKKKNKKKERGKQGREMKKLPQTKPENKKKEKAKQVGKMKKLLEMKPAKKKMKVENQENRDMTKETATAQVRKKSFQNPQQKKVRKSKEMMKYWL